MQHQNPRQSTKSSVQLQPTPLELEMYKQAHETRRKWEGYIWQWGVVVTALVSFSAVLLAAPSKTGGLSSLSEGAPEIVFLGKAMLFLLAIFLLSIALNVFRARQLMKRIERTIVRFHDTFGLTAFPIVPGELDDSSNRFSWFLSSTRYSVLAHFLAFAVFLSIAIYEVFSR